MYSVHFKDNGHIGIGKSRILSNEILLPIMIVTNITTIL